MGIKLFFEPLDTLFFRDNKPFTAGEDSFAESKFPSPLTIFGAIGNYILEKNNTDLAGFFKSQNDQSLGKYDPDLNSTRLKLKGPFIFSKKMYLPPPANLFLFGTSDFKKLFPDKDAHPKWDIKSNTLKPLRLIEDMEYEPVKDFIPDDEIAKVLDNSEIISFMGKLKEDYFFKPERKFGHKLNRGTLTVDEGFLYSTQHLRFHETLNGTEFEKTELMVFVEGFDSFNFSDDVIFLGGERKRSRIRAEKADNLYLRNNKILADIKHNKQFFVYFITPAIFSNGYTRYSWPIEFNNAKLISAAVNKPLYLSGWQRTNNAQGCPRPIRKAVPAGSLYFFEASDWKDEQFDALYDRYNFNESLSEQYSCAGFGIALIGVW